MPGELALGWEEFRSGRWDAARAIFEAATAAGGGAEGFEGLSWAAWWRDDAGAVFAARERAYALYRQRGDRAGAARMATWLAADELDFNGALSVSSGWLRRARRLVEPLEEGPEHGWLAFHEGYVARLRGDNAARGAARRSQSCVGSSAAPAPDRCAHARTSPRECSSPRGQTTSAPARCSRCRRPFRRERRAIRARARENRAGGDAGRARARRGG